MLLITEFYSTGAYRAIKGKELNELFKGGIDSGLSPREKRLAVTLFNDLFRDVTRNF